MSEINILYGYQLVGCPEEFSQELNEYDQRMKEEGSKDWNSKSTNDFIDNVTQ